MLSFILLQRHFRFKVTANDFQTYIALLGSSLFSRRAGMDDEAEKVFSSNLKGVASKKFSGGSPPGSRSVFFISA